jgi:CBS domain-containing protein
MSTRSKKETVKEIMTEKVISLPTSKKTIDALELMVKKDVGSIIILQRGKLYGIITERDIVRRITKDFEYLNRRLRETATKPVVTVLPDAPVLAAFALLLKKKIRRLPVVEGGELLGIVTERDLFKWVVEVGHEMPKTVRDLVSESP